MNYKFLRFMQQRFQVSNAYCPKFDWDKFVANEFPEDQAEMAIKFTNKLIECRYLSLVKKGGVDYFAITGYGFEMINRNTIIEVDS